MSLRSRSSLSSHGGDGGGSSGPVRLSQMIGSPTFRSSAINAVAMLPLLSSSRDGKDNPNTHSSQSYNEFLRSLHRYNVNEIQQNQHKPITPQSDNNSLANSNDMVVVVPNSNLTRPSDWKYQDTPLRNFHWGHGCQRLSFFDGRPYHSRKAHDRLINHELTRHWIDLCPSRRTAALIGVLNVRDCPDQASLETAIQEWKQWGERYSTPPYEVTAHGRDVARDTVVPRLFVFDSFHEDFVQNTNVDLEKATKALKIHKSCIVAFPPFDSERPQMMDGHVKNVVLNDLTVAIFREIEAKIRESDSLMTQTPTKAQPTKTGFFGRGVSSSNTSSGAGATSSTSKTNEGGGSTADEEAPVGSKKLSIDSLAKVVSSTSELASPKTSNTRSRSNDLSSSSDHGSSKGTMQQSMSSSVTAQLLTPLDEFWEHTELSPKDAHQMMKRQVARRKKFTADLCLLAGSPLDAYERYTNAADLSRTTTPDPLWYASALEGCAAVHIAMADVGGFNVDEYLESSFQLPEEIMACALVPAGESKSSSGEYKGDPKKKSMPKVIRALCEDALNVTARHPKIACFHAELLLKLAWYTAELEDVHVRCQWGLGGESTDGEGNECCYGGDPNDEKRRWELASATRLNFLDLKNKDGEDVVQLNTLKRCQNCSEFMHRATGTAALDPVTRADIALRCLTISWRGIRPTTKPTGWERSTDRIQLKRKAAYFAVAAAEAMSDVEGTIPEDRATALWIHASRLLSKTTNSYVDGGNYGWATLRAVALHAIVMHGTTKSAEEAAQQLLLLMGKISPPYSSGQRQFLSPSPEKRASGSGRSLSLASARSLIRDGAKEVRSLYKEQFANPSDMSSFVAIQSKWVEDDPLEPVLLPMGHFSSDFALEVLELPSVWSTMPYDHCAMAQERLIRQINDLRKTATLSKSSEQKLPIEITSIGIVNPDISLKLERVKLKVKRKTEEEKNHSMATFFNPYAKQETKIKPRTIPRGEEQYIAISFSNTLSIPFSIDSCHLKFNTLETSKIKAPSISFEIPGQAKKFTVRFPFIVLRKLSDEDIDTIEVQGISITALSRSFFLPIGVLKEEQGDEATVKEKPILPDSASIFPLRDYSKRLRQEDQKPKTIISPRIEITPPQPKLRFCFASSSTPMDEDTIIPVLLADGEIFTLPKICVTNDTGMDGLGTIEELQISAIGLPGRSDVVLYDMTKSSETAQNEAGSGQEIDPISISAACVGMDANTLNSSTTKTSTSSFIATKLSASPSMGVKTSGCDMVLRFRYRGKAASLELEVWRKYEVEVRILRTKGPRIPSLSFRCDLLWDSGYAELCQALVAQENTPEINRLRSYSFDLDEIGGAEKKKEFVANRLGQDPGVHVCGEKVAVMISVSNESGAPIVMTRTDGSSFGFPSSQMDMLSVSKGVGAKIPIFIPRVDRSENVCKDLTSMVKFHWKSNISENLEPEDAQETSGCMFPSNFRTRQGIIELPYSCLDTIIDENPIFLSRICKAPCSIDVKFTSGSNSATVQTPIDVSIVVNIAKWLSPNLRKQTKCVLRLCCARKKSGVDNEDVADNDEDDKENRDFVWIGQTQRNLPIDHETMTFDHKGRLFFLSPGEYFVSACLSFSRADSDNPVEETWWAEHAAKLRVSKSAN